MTADLILCSTCKGRCCRIAGFSTVHDPPFWSVLPTHVCPDCDDGTYEICGDPEPAPKPVRTAEDERAAVVAWLRDKGHAWRNAEVVMLADMIKCGEHRREEG